MPPHLAALRRYPVKSMGGEPLDTVELDARGLVGDRWFAVADEDGHFASGKRTRRFRRHDEVFGFDAVTTGAGVQVRRAGRCWQVGDPALDAELSAAMGRRMTVAAEQLVPHQDAGAVSLVGTATLRWCARELGVDADPRRLRVNLVVETDEPFVEEGWCGRVLSIGSAALRVVAPTRRCRMVDVAQDGQRPAARWLKPLAQRRGLDLGVYADVVTAGRVGVGDAVQPARR